MADEDLISPPKLRALITRAADDAKPLCEALRARGLEPVLVPLIHKVPDLEAVAEVAARGHDGWVLTSPAAVRALREVRVRPAWVAAIGPATRRAAEDQGIAVDRVPPRALREAMIEALGELRGQRVLYPKSDRAPPGLSEALRASGARVDEVVAYRNVEPLGVARALRAVWPVDLVLLLSGSAARRLAAHIPPPWEDRVRVLAIGPSTEEAARAQRIRVDAVADPHTLSGLLSLLEAQLIG
ncbi:MAG: uroporphyrinogen-III synthase [Deltaproteobacteria bacterium]|nr:MAG: uroporphyrinogen-III synthase [Deltaproteobacteria bacterium]